jgi:hypothetical protein
LLAVDPVLQELALVGVGAANRLDADNATLALAYEVLEELDAQDNML